METKEERSKRLQREAQVRYKQNPANQDKIAERRRKYREREDVKEKERERARQRRVENPARAKEIDRASRQRNIERIKERESAPEFRKKFNERARTKRLTDPLRTIWRDTRSRALKLKIPFTIQVDDLVWVERCPVLDIPLAWDSIDDRKARPSIDKIIPEKGYIPGNVCIISWEANRLKSNNTIETLQALLNYMSRV